MLKLKRSSTGRWQLLSLAARKRRKAHRARSRTPPRHVVSNPAGIFKASGRSFHCSRRLARVRRDGLGCTSIVGVSFCRRSCAALLWPGVCGGVHYKHSLLSSWYAFAHSFIVLISWMACVSFPFMDAQAQIVNGKWQLLFGKGDG